MKNLHSILTKTKMFKYQTSIDYELNLLRSATHNVSFIKC